MSDANKLLAAAFDTMSEAQTKCKQVARDLFCNLPPDPVHSFISTINVPVKVYFFKSRKDLFPSKWIEPSVVAVNEDHIILVRIQAYIIGKQYRITSPLRFKRLLSIKD